MEVVDVLGLESGGTDRHAGRQAAHQFRQGVHVHPKGRPCRQTGSSRYTLAPAEVADQEDAHGLRLRSASPCGAGASGSDREVEFH
ncbi:hypothetical protein K9V56_012025 [Paucibacter aquatile]|nr:hypothetical protein [Paucibacter aquatile]WIV95785.1 hypothetical protein K9V56_012025 [Paucibacter aquatile]